MSVRELKAQVTSGIEAGRKAIAGYVSARKTLDEAATIIRTATEGTDSDLPGQALTLLTNSGKLVEITIQRVTTSLEAATRYRDRL